MNFYFVAEKLFKLSNIYNVHQHKESMIKHDAILLLCCNNCNALCTCIVFFSHSKRESRDIRVKYILLRERG